MSSTLTFWLWRKQHERVLNGVPLRSALLQWRELITHLMHRGSKSLCNQTECSEKARATLTHDYTVQDAFICVIITGWYRRVRGSHRNYSQLSRNKSRNFWMSPEFSCLPIEATDDVLHWGFLPTPIVTIDLSVNHNYLIQWV